ncbi:hypothetical protein [Flavobacterium sp. 7A]|uniref:hypothetical protein n=1 Tax=Flavobacterium sp. 7A TaxID=2940571 RepID=UPI002226C0B8|nr:hypothetical protein [Flavobacterium sp. 7A]MCW2119127.1 hypothetical protein [Flavobacterium sp. 7A]
MKKLILSAAIILGSLTTMSAQDQSTTPTQETTETASSSTGFTEINTAEVPAAVTDALKKAYPDAMLTKAYVNEKKEYQLDVKVGDKEGSLFADENGKWIQK